MGQIIWVGEVRDLRVECGLPNKIMLLAIATTVNWMHTVYLRCRPHSSVIKGPRQRFVEPKTADQIISGAATVKSDRAITQDGRKRVTSLPALSSYDE